MSGRGHRLTLVSAATSAAELDQLRDLAPYCRGLHAVRIPLARSLWSCAQGLLSAAPLQARYCFAPAMTDMLRSAMAPPSSYDVVHVEHLRAALYGLRIGGLPRVYDAVDCMSRLLSQTAAHGPSLGNRLTARFELGRTARFESDLLQQFERVVVTVESERQALLGAAAAGARIADRVRVLPNGVDLDYFSPGETPRDPATLVYVGRMGYHANFAAARDLISAVLPRIWATHPQTRLLVVGADPPEALRSLAAQAGPRVEVTGYVADVRPYLARATVSVSPLRYAVGIQNKVLEAMAMATPVVATPAACAGLRAVAVEHVLIAADSDAIADAAVRLLDDPSLAQRLGASGRRYVAEHHDWRAVVRELEAVYAEAMASFSPAAPSRAQVGLA